MTTPRPVTLKLEGSDLLITWSDGVSTRYSPAKLREHCPCATCVDRRVGGATLPGQGEPQGEMLGLTIREVVPVGNYAYRIAFSDGHDTGIYTLDYLYRLGQPL